MEKANHQDHLVEDQDKHLRHLVVHHGSRKLSLVMSIIPTPEDQVAIVMCILERMTMAPQNSLIMDLRVDVVKLQQKLVWLLLR